MPKQKRKTSYDGWSHTRSKVTKPKMGAKYDTTPPTPPPPKKEPLIDWEDQVRKAKKQWNTLAGIVKRYSRSTRSGWEQFKALGGYKKK